VRCVMTYGLYLRADGRLPCYCGAGETVTLGRYVPGEGRDFVEDVFHKGLFAHIREAQACGQTPFPGVCERCSYLEPDAPFDAEERVLRWFHLEPSMHCMLDCEWCQGQRTDTSGLKTMPMELLTEVTDSFARAGYRLEKGNVCGVGEPTLNPHLWEMMRYVKDRLGGDMLISTNGNSPYSDAIVPSGVDKVKIAIDSTRQEQYQRYRKRGSIERVFEFTRRIAEAREQAGVATPKLIWQYIMFNFNDSDEELLELQQRARQMGVDSLRIVYTRCNNYSSKSREAFPRDFDDIDFFQIKDESLLTVEEARERLASADALRAAGELEEAATGYIGLVNDTTKRLLLGVETYADFLDAVYNMERVVQDGTPSLTQEQAHALYAMEVAAYAALADIYTRKGEERQAGRYRAFMQKAGMVKA